MNKNVRQRGGKRLKYSISVSAEIWEHRARWKKHRKHRKMLNWNSVALQILSHFDTVQFCGDQ